jgi:hypothetical protein
MWWERKSKVSLDRVDDKVRRREEEDRVVTFKSRDRIVSIQHSIALNSMNECLRRNGMFGKLWMAREATKIADKTETCYLNENK